MMWVRQYLYLFKIWLLQNKNNDCHPPSDIIDCNNCNWYF